MIPADSSQPVGQGARLVERAAVSRQQVFQEIGDRTPLAIAVLLGGERQVSHGGDRGVDHQRRDPCRQHADVGFDPVEKRGVTSGIACCRVPDVNGNIRICHDRNSLLWAGAAGLTVFQTPGVASSHGRILSDSGHALREGSERSIWSAGYGAARRIDRWAVSWRIPNIGWLTTFACPGTRAWRPPKSSLRRRIRIGHAPP